MKVFKRDVGGDLIYGTSPHTGVAIRLSRDPQLIKRFLAALFKLHYFRIAEKGTMVDRVTIFRKLFKAGRHRHLCLGRSRVGAVHVTVHRLAAGVDG